MNVRIAVSLGTSPLHREVFVDVITALASLGFDSVWVSDVLTGQGPDPIVALSTAAQLDPKLKLGATLLLPGHNDLRLAKALASLDVLSGGRLLLTFVPGLAHGPERDAIGVPVAQRAAAFERTLPRLRNWWAGEQVDGIALSPRPLQDPLEFWLGGLAPASLERCGRLADGWLGATCTPEQARAAKSTIDAAAAAAARQVDVEHFGVSIGYAHSTAAAERLTAAGGRRPGAPVPVGYSALRETLLSFIEVGMSKFVVRLPAPDDPDDPAAWRAELVGLAEAVVDLQT